MAKFGVVPHEVGALAVDRDMAKLAPKFRTAIMVLLEWMETEHGEDPIVFEGFRSDGRATYLHGFGRLYDDGRGIVTNAATAAKTWHRYGLAVDIISREHEWSAPESFWTHLRERATELGLRSGNDWDRDGVPVGEDPDEHTADRPHVQWGPPMRVTPSDHAWELLHSQGVEAVWREVGAL